MEEYNSVIKELEEWINCPFALDAEIDPTLVHRAYELLREQHKKIERDEQTIAILTRDINYHNCNSCARDCDIQPEPGAVVRVNCFHWKGKE